MAEARFAVRPSAALHHVGFEVDTSRKHAQLSIDRNGLVLYIPHPFFIAKGIRRSFWRGVDQVQFALYPIPLSVVTAMALGVFAWVYRAPSDSWVRNGFFARWLWDLDSLNPISRRISPQYRLPALLANAAVTGVVLFTSVQRFFMRQVLKYNGWIYERGTPSKKTILWSFVLKTFFMHKLAKTEAYQSCLPAQPLPELKLTVERFLASVQPLYEGRTAEWDRLNCLADEFLKDEGPRFQRLLKLKYLFADNYMTDWWIKYVYLAQRESLCINSNWFGIMFARHKPTSNQASRTAALIYNLVKVKKRLDKSTFTPQFGGLAPLDMDQYRYAFNTTRVPGREMDVLVQHEGSKHIVALYKGRFYRLEVLHPKTNHQLTPYQLEAAIEAILRSDDETDLDEALIPAFTTAPRAEWADIRDKHFVNNTYNVKPLRVVEESIFVLCLDEELPASIEEESVQYLCGNGHNRWSDKSFNLVTVPDGRCGVHVEHSWGDALTLAHVVEHCSASDEHKEYYGPDGRVVKLDEDEVALREGRFKVFPPNRIRFTIDKEMRQRAQSVHAQYLSQLRDLDLKVIRFDDYGKDLPKKMRCSPDAWIQMAMQLAYFRDQRRFDQTYESATMRLYRKGRTETIRSVSADSCAFVRAMENAAAAPATRAALLRAACERHQMTSRDAVAGGGVDRHLFALYCVSAGQDAASEFLQAALAPKWRLSTSQVLTRQLPEGFHPKETEAFETPNGGFGPVADDGYGVCYCLYGEKLLYFVITAKHSCEATSASGLGEKIVAALREMRELIEAK